VGEGNINESKIEGWIITDLDRLFGYLSDEKSSFIFCSILNLCFFTLDSSSSEFFSFRMIPGYTISVDSGAKDNGDDDNGDDKDVDEDDIDIEDGRVFDSLESNVF